MKKRDLLLLLIGLAILGFLWLAPPVSTPLMPRDDTHQEMYQLWEKDGKRAAEARCEECHNAEVVPFSPEHPGKSRCLLCHRKDEKGGK